MLADVSNGSDAGSDANPTTEGDKFNQKKKKKRTNAFEGLK